MANSTLNTQNSALITGVILAGGQGRRMGGVDKGLKVLRGKPMVAWVIERFAPQVAEILINANQNLPIYGGFGYRVIPDEIGGFAGPLAGLHRGLSEAKHDLVATTPCDSPFLPADLIGRLHAALETNNADLTVALSRPLEGEWVGLDSRSTYEPSGIGLADTRICDTRGTVGRVLQGLVLEERRGHR